MKLHATLTPTERAALKVLKTMHCTQPELATGLGITPNTTARIIFKLKHLHLIVAREHPIDRRKRIYEAAP